MLLPLGVVLVLAGVALLVLGIRGLWIHRAEFANIRTHPLEDDPDTLERVRQALGRTDGLIESLLGKPGTLSVPLDAVAGMRGFGKMPEPLQVPGISVFFGAILIVVGVLFVMGL